MIDNAILQDALADYKEVFNDELWPEEKFKWRAVQCFQDNWNVNSDNFAEMLKSSLSETHNLLVSRNNFPRDAIIVLAENYPEEVRGMFLDLFDEQKDVVERIQNFKQQAARLHEKLNDGGRNHFQNESAISTYLWLRYPDKYYIYRFGISQKVAQILGSDLKFKMGAYAENLRNCYHLFDQINEVVQQDDDLRQMLQANLTPDYYADPKLKTLTHDIAVYISRNPGGGISREDWFPKDYSPGITVKGWVDLLKNSTVFTQGSLEIMKRMKDHGGQATCSQLSEKYGNTTHFYNNGSTTLAMRVFKKTGCPLYEDKNENNRYWPVLFIGKRATKDIPGAFIWKLRDELSQAIDQIDLSNVDLYDKPDSTESDVNYWWLNSNPKIWSFDDLAVGKSQSYSLFNENGNKRRIYQNFLDARIGDKVIGYESHPTKQVVALAEIITEQDGKKLDIQKVEGLATPIDHSQLKEYPELQNMEYFRTPQGSLYKLSKDEYNFLMDIIREANPKPGLKKNEPYSPSDFLNEVYMSQSRYQSLIDVLENKKNIILQGAPGVGKTFAAKRLAYSIMGEKDEERIEFIQFHQNYSYEDFIMGYKPAGDGFELQTGIFYRFCQKAANEPDKKYFFIIDEINRGNMSKIFGELLMLIERGYRGVKLTLAYNGKPFSVPDNLYLIGLMNTADRSLAMIDYALRRRFSFFEMEPGFDTEGFQNYQSEFEDELFDDLILRIIELNNEITLDRSLGKGFCIGHSYFCGLDKPGEEDLRAIVEFDIVPMLSEYWFDDQDKLQRWENILFGLFQ